jgi:hypothetical protein
MIVSPSWRAWAASAALAWLLVIAYAYAVAPRGPLAIALFLALLYLALAATLIPLCRVVGAHLHAAAPGQHDQARHAWRRGLLLTLLVVGNLALLGARAWSPLVALLGLAAAGIAEALALGLLGT